MNWFKYAAPQRFYPLAGTLVRWCSVLAAMLAIAGLVIGLLIAPTDFQQGESYRIIFVHVPASWMSMVIFVAMAFWSAIGLAFNARLAFMLARALAPTGALMCFLALWTGSLWGKPTWGAWWVWDARLTSELILLFLYIGYLALVGVVNVPIIYFSVKWWNTLHQGASVSISSAPRMASIMLTGMLLMALAFWLYAIATALARTRILIREREAQTAWMETLQEQT